MYDTLRPELLTASDDDRAIMARDPTHVVSWDLFEHNSLPYLELRRPFILGLADGKWKPSLAHWFMRVLHDEGKLARVFTQNIDGLDFKLGLPDDLVVPVHGSMGSVGCEFCGASASLAGFRDAVRAQIRNIYCDRGGGGSSGDGGGDAGPEVSTPIACAQCGRCGVKPTTVLYGRSLPEAFFAASSAEQLAGTDLLITMGTSLTVHPAASLPAAMPPTTMRAVINRERVGEGVGLSFSAAGAAVGTAEAAVATSTFASPGHTPPALLRDVFVGGDCDEAILELASRLGWLDKLAALRDCMAPSSMQLLDAKLQMR